MPSSEARWERVRSYVAPRNFTEPHLSEDELRVNLWTVWQELYGMERRRPMFMAYPDSEGLYGQYDPNSHVIVVWKHGHQMTTLLHEVAHAVATADDDYGHGDRWLLTYARLLKRFTPELWAQAVAGYGRMKAVFAHSLCCGAPLFWSFGIRRCWDCKKEDTRLGQMRTPGWDR